MKIGIFFEGRKKKDMGGGFYLQVRNAQLINKLKDEFSEIYLISSDDNTSNYLKEKNYNLKNFRYNFLNKYTSKLFTFNYIKDFFQKIKIHHPFYNFLKKNDFDLIVFLNPSNFANFCGDKSFIINIWDLDHKYNSQFPEHTSNYTYEKREKLISNVIFRAFKIFVPHEKIKKDLVKIYRCNEEIIEVQTLIPYPPELYLENKNKIDYNKLFLKLNLPINKKYIIYPAAYWPHKNHKYIIDAALKLKSAKKNFHFIFCGPDIGNYKYIKKNITNNKLENCISTFNLLNDNELISLYLNCSAVIMPTYGGPTNLPIFESFFFKKPIFYSDQLLDDSELKNSVISIDLNDPDDFVKKVEIINDKTQVENIVNNGANYYKKFCDDQNFINKYRSVFKNFNYLKSRWKS